MKKSFLKPLVIAGFGIVLFSGCSTKQFKTEINRTGPNYHSIKVDQDSTSAERILIMKVTRTNYKYALGAGATLAKDNGFSHFSIVTGPLMNQYRDKNVQTIEDAYNACDTNGEGGFRWAFMSLNNIMGFSRCDNITKQYLAKNGLVQDHRNVVTIEVHLHNNNLKDNITFNADEVLASDLLKGLNMDYFRNSTRKE
jgi:hypothetical protein